MLLVTNKLFCNVRMDKYAGVQMFCNVRMSKCANVK
jgi:hypothetical protein